MIHVLIGTRAQLIKMIPVMHLLQARKIEYNFVFMAQHHETIYEMLRDFGIKNPDYVLCDTGSDIVSTPQMVRWSFSVLKSGFRKRAELFKNDKNGIVVIHGDAPPLFLGAILAKSQKLLVASVEAGLRSFKWLKPFPEEITRVGTGKLGLVDLHFCQDTKSMENAKAYKGRAILTDGNTIVDAINLAAKINRERVDQLRTEERRFAIVSLHRFETISKPEKLKNVVDLINRISTIGDINLKFILHPPTRAALAQYDLLSSLEQNNRIELLPRMTFLSFNSLLMRAEFIVTDGGSNQEESAHLGIPCLLFRSETERQDGLGRNVVLSEFKTEAIDDFVLNHEKYRFPVNEILSSPSEKIVEELKQYS